MKPALAPPDTPPPLASRRVGALLRHPSARIGQTCLMPDRHQRLLRSKSWRRSVFGPRTRIVSVDIRQICTLPTGDYAGPSNSR